MASVPEQIVATFTPLLASITGGLHLGIAPPGTPMPYAIFAVVSAPAEYVYAGNSRGDWAIDFVVFAAGADAAHVLCEALASTYRAASIGFSSRQLTRPMPDIDSGYEDGGDGGTPVGVCRTSFEFNEGG